MAMTHEYNEKTPVYISLLGQTYKIAKIGEALILSSYDIGHRYFSAWYIKFNGQSKTMT